MKEDARKQRNKDRVAELYKTFATRISNVIKDLEAQGERPRIQDAWRSKADQLIAYNSGHAKVKYSFHNVTGAKGEKEALAVDMLDDEAPLNPGVPYLLKLASAAEREGLSTGIRWGVPKNVAKAINNAIAAQNWKAPVKVGWDPTHIEPTGMTISDAKKGVRPK
ncbi:hypothetical protein ACSBOB_15725 [Mesorhizobium sp. ASY16-5R]|uniref:hypothetical protein n=1 Tax=Mesorhizobium sp. ASY16-5R TaxID=3445772 RepID=UPI003F9F99D8